MNEEQSGSRGFFATCFPTRAALGLALTVCVFVPVLLVALQTAQNPKFSPIDEAAHWDYVKRVAGGSVPRMGLLLEQSTLREEVCRGTALEGLVVPKCRTPVLKASSFPGGGQQYEAQQPPTYYALTVPVRWLGHDVFGFSDVGATRAGGYVWLPLGLLALWCAGLVLGLSPSQVGSGVLLIATAPLVIYSSSVVSNDVPAIFAGGFVALLAALAYRRPGKWVTPVLATSAFFVVSIKATNLFPIVAVATLFALRQWTGRDGQTPLVTLVRSWLADGGALLLGGLAAAVAWVVVNRALALVDPRTLLVFGVLRVHPVPPGVVLREALAFLGPLTDSFVSPGTLGNNLQLTLETLLKFLLLAAALSALFVTPRRWPHVLGLISLGMLLAGGFAFGIGLRQTYNIDPGLSGRYGLAMVPLLVLVLVASVRGHWAERGVWTLGGLMLVANLVALTV
jgi:hypothetical protein